MFLTENDYIVSSSNSLNVLQQSSPDKREKAERMACEEIAGYLRGRYDTDRVFSMQGTMCLSCVPATSHYTTCQAGCPVKWDMR